MFVGIGVSPQNIVKIDSYSPPAGELLIPFDGTWTIAAGPAWVVAAEVATSVEGEDGAISKELAFPVASSYDYAFSINVNSNTEGGTLLIQLFGDLTQTIYNDIPSAGLLSFTFTANANNTDFRIRSLDSVVVELASPSLMLDV